MKLTIVATVLLGLLLTPALALFLPSNNGNLPIPNNPSGIRRQFTIGGAFQTLFFNRQRLVASIEQTGPGLSWKTIWNYNTGYIATKVVSEGTCYISTMNRGEVPNFQTLPVVAEEARLMGQGLPTKQVTFVIRERIYNLQSFGPDIFNMCNGLNTYMAYEVQGPVYTSPMGSCLRLDVLQLLSLNYCHANLFFNSNPNNPNYNPNNPNFNPNNPNFHPYNPNNPNFNPNNPSFDPNNPSFNPNNPNNPNFNPNFNPNNPNFNPNFNPNNPNNPNFNPNNPSFNPSNPSYNPNNPSNPNFNPSLRI